MKKDKATKRVINPKWRKAEYHGYTVYETGLIVNRHGREVQKRLRYGRYEARLFIDKKPRQLSAARLIYRAFHPFDSDDQSLCVTHIDRDRTNIHLDNLKLVERKDIIQGQHNTQSLITDDEADEIRRLYTGTAGANQYDKSGHSMKNLADLFGVSKSAIWQIVHGHTRNQAKYKLK